MTEPSSQLVTQPTATPTTKLTAVGAGGLGVGVVLYLAQLAGLSMPPEVAEAIVLAGAWVAGYVKRDRRVAAAVEQVLHGRHEATT